MELQEPRRVQSFKPVSQKLVVYCRFPQLLARAATHQAPPAKSRLPLAVVQGQTVRAVCDSAEAVGVFVGQGIIKARRLCPALTAVPLESVDHRPETSTFLDSLADISPVVDPDGPDAAFAVVRRSDIQAAQGISATLLSCAGPSLIGFGASRLEARACAECGLLPDHLADASVQWLWPDDPKVVASLLRLGLETFGQVAAVGEGVLFYQFGKIAGYGWDLRRTSNTPICRRMGRVI